MKELNSFYIFINLFILISTKTILSQTIYPSYDEIYLNLKQIKQKYPNDVELEIIGFSRELRNISCLTIKPLENEDNLAILVDAGIHAREWITPVTAIYLINKILLKNNSYLRKYVTWYIIPLLNPDGYEYSRTNDGYWRKNRNDDGNCLGIDLNRNFDYHWKEDNECSITYSGNEPNSELEIQALTKFTLCHKNIKLYLTLHSYGSLIFYPWAYTTERTSNYNEYLEIAKEAIEAIYTIRKSMYEYGQPGELIYNAFGSSMDWMVGVANVTYAFAIELGKEQDTFYPSNNEKKYLFKEAFEAVKIFHKYVNSLNIKLF